MRRLARVTGALAKVAAIAVAGLLAAAPAAKGAPGASGSVTLKAEAGLGGVCRPGRWMPVRVWLANDGEDVSGELVVEWGDAKLNRALVLASPARIQVDVYVRTLDVRGTVTVKFRTHDVDVQSVDIPVHSAGLEERVTICVGEPDARAASQTTCTTTIGVDALPRSMRGWDAADEVVMAAGVDGTLPGLERTAFARWQSARALETSGRLTNAPPLEASDGSRRTTGAMMAGGAAYLVALLVVGFTAPRIRRRPLLQHALVVALAALATSAVLTAGRVGPWSAVDVRHVSTVQQVSAGGALLSMRGVVEYPAFDAYDVRAEVADLSMTERGGGPAAQRYDADGYPDLPVVMGLGAVQPFAAEGVIDFAPFDVTVREGLVRVTNRSASVLTDCAFPDAFSLQRVGTLAPGQSAEARSKGTTDAPVFSCRLQDGPVTFSDQRHNVHMHGTSLVTIDLPRPASEMAAAR